MTVPCAAEAKGAAARAVAARRPAVLLADADAHALKVLGSAFARDGFRVHRVRSGRQAIGAVRRRRFDAVVADHHLPDARGLSVLRAMADDAQPVPFVLVGARLAIPVVVEAMRLGAADILEKPVTPARLVSAVRAAIERRSAPAGAAAAADRADAGALALDRPEGTAPALRPGSVAERWAVHVLKGCSADRDPRTLKLWAASAGVSYSSLRETCGLVGIATHDARDLTRMLRAVIQSANEGCAPDVLLDVGDRRTVGTLLARAGIRPQPRGAPIPVTRFLDAQQFVDGNNAGLRALRRLLLGPA